MCIEPYARITRAQSKRQIRPMTIGGRRAGNRRRSDIFLITGCNVLTIALSVCMIIRPYPVRARTDVFHQ